MDEVLDIIWFKIVAGVHYVKGLLDIVLGPLNTLGPAMAILIIAVLTVALTIFLTRKFKTKRYKKLHREFKHWFNIRQEALKCEDPEKAKQLAKNIDQARLNKVYYDYFFEGFMNGLATRMLPILVILSYVNEAYRPENLLTLFGREYVFKIGGSDGNPMLIGSVFWFILSLLLVHLAWYLVKKVYNRYRKQEKQPTAPATSTSG